MATAQIKKGKSSKLVSLKKRLSKAERAKAEMALRKKSVHKIRRNFGDVLEALSLR